jgi:hypothetical protein
LKRDQADAVLAFVRFWEETTGRRPAELVFDSRFTTMESLSKLNGMGIRFLTLRRKGPEVVRKLLALPPASWTPCPLDVPGRKYKNPKIIEERIRVKTYEGEIRQIAAKDLGRELPTLLITNDFKGDPDDLIARYAKRMIIENAIADGVHFFHLDALCSSLNVEVDFSVVLTVVANGLYRLLADRIKGFEQATAKKLHRKFVNTAATIEVRNDRQVLVHLPLQAHNPLLMEAGLADRPVKVPWLHDATVRVRIPTTCRKS